MVISAVMFRRRSYKYTTLPLWNRVAVANFDPVRGWERIAIDKKSPASCDAGLLIWSTNDGQECPSYDWVTTSCSSSFQMLSLLQELPEQRRDEQLERGMGCS
jgi:hypothetical protein